MAYTRTTTVDASHGGDSVKQAVLDCDTDITGIFANLNTHEGLTATHGATGAVTGTTNTQTLTNKTLTTPVIASLYQDAGKTLLVTMPAATDTLVGKATTDTLTNKTFDTAGTGNSFSINGTAVSSVSGTGAVVLASSATLTSPTLTTPTLDTPAISNFSSATHDHSSTATGGTISATAPNVSSATGTLAIANGGTGQTSKTAGFNALSPLSTLGDMLYGGASGTGTRLGIGTAGQFLKTNSSANSPEWVTVSLSTLGGTTPVANGGTGQTTYTNGELLIGNTTGNTLTKATLTAGTGISVTNSTGSITIASTVTGLTATSGTPGYYGARAWVTFDGTGTPAIGASVNVTSITDNGTGDYTINFTDNMPDDDYVVAGMTGAVLTTNANSAVSLHNTGPSSAPTTKTTSAVRIVVGSGAYYNTVSDNKVVGVVIFD